MLVNFLPSPSIDTSKPQVRRRPPMQVAQSTSSESFEAGLHFPGTSAISDAELASGQRVQKCQRLVRDVNAAFYDDFKATVDTESAKGFLKLVKRFEPIGSLSVGADSCGRIVATWRNGEGALTLEFLNAFKFKFAITSSENGEVTRRWGTGHLLTFLSAEPLAVRFLKAC